MSTENIETTQDAKARAKAEKAYTKATRPWYKKKRFWLLGIVAIILVFTLTSGGDDNGADDTAKIATSSSQETTAQEEAPLVVSAQELIDALDNNALAAATEYEGKLVTVTGILSNIDSSGDYFSLKGTEDFALTTILVKIDEEHLSTVSSFTPEQEITVTGRITSVGEVLGYSMDAETIN